MKRIFTHFALACALLATATTAHAQDAADRLWWGHFGTGDISPYEVGALGTERQETYNMAIRLNPADNASIAGATIHGIRFMMTTTTGFKDVSVWISKQLPASADAADIVKTDVPEANLVSYAEGFVEVQLEEPVEVGEALYVGYSLTPTNIADDYHKYPMITYGEAGTKDAFYFKTDVGQPQWQSLEGYNYGNIVLQVLITNPGLARNAAELQSATETVTLAGGEDNSLPVTLTNRGLNGVSSISYTYTIDGQESEENTYTLPAALTSLDTSAEVLIPIPAGTTAGKTEKVTVSLKQVNGTANEVASPTVEGYRLTIGEQPKRRVLVEEFTGTWCGWCTRGLAALDWLHENRAEETALIAIHQGSYTPDPMQIPLADYAYYPSLASYVSGFPSALLNRNLSTDPFYGTTDASLFDDITIQNDIDREVNSPTEATIKVTPIWNADSTAFTAKTDVTFLVNRNDAPYGIAYALIEDGLSGKGSAWSQANYYVNYASYASSFKGDLLIPYVTGSNPMTGLTYNHVAIAAWNITAGLDGSINAPITKDEEQSYTLETALPRSSVIQEKKNLSLVAFLINRNNGKVVNCDVMPLMSQETVDGIATVNALQPAGVESIYDLLGRKQQTAGRGLNIVRSADGKTRKVLVK
ncbi:MAG: Omp28-related outer membrane protein [Alloprevotella sp.]|nr:Omp28-related outer membrane protein [Alloprevotella sp.]